MLTTAMNRTKLLPVATMLHRVSVLKQRRHSRISCGFFVRKISVLHLYVGLGVAPARVAGAFAGTLTMPSPAPMISVLLPGLKLKPKARS